MEAYFITTHNFFHQLLTEEIEKELREEAVEVLGGNVTGVDDTNLDAAIPDANLPLIYARLTSHTTLTHLKNLKASYYGDNYCFCILYYSLCVFLDRSVSQEMKCMKDVHTNELLCSAFK